jgi:hypothetical protein
MEAWGAQRSETALAQLRPGTHLCRFYEDSADLARGAAAFVAGGLEAGDRVVYLSTDRGRDETRASLEEAGVDACRAMVAGQLVVRSSAEVYGHAPPEFGDLADGFRALRDQARADGLAGLRVAAEMGDAAEWFGSFPRLLGWEAAASRVQGETGISSVCLYDRRHFSDDDVRQVAAQHDGAAPASAPPAMACFYMTPRGLRVAGELDVSNRARFLEVVEARMRVLPCLHLDLAELAFTDVGTFVELSRLVDDRPGAVVTLRSASPTLQRHLALGPLRHPRVLVS